VYVGDLVWNQTHHGKYSSFEGGAIAQTEQPNRTIKRQKAADMLVTVGAHKALIDRDTFQRAREALARNRQDTNPRKSPDGSRHLLTRLLVCSDCGAYMSGSHSRGRRFYACSTYYPGN